MAASGGLPGALDTMLTNKAFYRSAAALGPAYEHPERVTDETIETYLRPHLASAQRTRDVERFLAAVREQNGPAAARLLDEAPGIARANVFAACCVGEAEFVAEALAAEPGRATEGHAPDGWPPLLYLCASPDRIDPSTHTPRELAPGEPDRSKQRR